MIMTVKVSTLDTILVSTVLISFSVKFDTSMLNKSSFLAFLAVEYVFFLFYYVKFLLKVLLSETKGMTMTELHEITVSECFEPYCKW